MSLRFDWECETCEAIFEQWDNNRVCTYCGSKKIHKVFITPPGKLSKSTKFMDSTMQSLIQANGMTDYQNDPSRIHDAPNQMTLAALDPKKDIGEQAAARIANMRGPVSNRQIMSIPYNQGKPIQNIPLMDSSSGDALRQVTKFHRNQKTRLQQTEYIGRIDKNGRVF